MTNHIANSGKMVPAEESPLIDEARSLALQFFRSDDCPISVKMVLGAKPAALFRLVAEVHEAGRKAGLEEAAREVEQWFPCGTIDDPRHAAGKALRDAIRGLGKGLTPAPE